MRILASVLGLAGLLVLGSTPLRAAEPPPPPDQLMLHAGDTITWTTTNPHQLRFGGSVSSGQLTSYAVVQQILDLTPAPTVKDGVATWPSGTPVTAKVKEAQPGLQFDFTCGFPPHSNFMVSVQFTVAKSDGQPARKLEIKSASNPIRWVLDGKYDLNRPK